MKTNAPEKIWINPTIDLQRLSGVMDKNSIEYTRTDAFIEKACEYISLHQCEYIDFDEFKNYMEGE